MIEDVTKSAKGEVRAEDRSVRVERSAVGVVRGKNVEVRQAGLGLVLSLVVSVVWNIALYGLRRRALMRR